MMTTIEIPVPLVPAAGMKPSYGAAVESHGSTTGKTHAPASVKSPTSTVTSTLGKCILWRVAEDDTGDEGGEN
jgi:hypothetical protein